MITNTGKVIRRSLIVQNKHISSKTLKIAYLHILPNSKGLSAISKSFGPKVKMKRVQKVLKN